MSNVSEPNNSSVPLSVAEWDDEACCRFESACQSGQRPRIEEFLTGAPEAGREVLLRELLALELEYRVRAGETPVPEEYRQRFPEQVALVDAVFVEVIPLISPSDSAAQETLRHRRTPDTMVDPGGTRPNVGLSADNDPSSASIDSPVVTGYEILGKLGAGGMGIVYKARQVKLNRLVALKMIKAGVDAEPHELERFRTEAETVARLQHPHIVQIHEVSEHDGQPYFALEFGSGGSLETKLNGTPLLSQEAAALVETLARAVHAAHQKGVIHRDLKPANVLLTEEGTPKVTDFGLAKKLDEAGLTQSGAIMGTPSYMAPEQAQGKSKEAGPMTDVYALGAVLYECLTGRPPFKAAAVWDTIRQVVSEEPVPPSRLNAAVPADLETICLKCLQKEPARRYGSPEALTEDLRRFQVGEPILARPVGRVEKVAKWVRRNPFLAGSLTAVVIVLIVGTLVSMYFGFDAVQQAELASKRATDLGEANDSLEKVNTELTQSRDRLDRIFAGSLLRPIGLRSGPVIDPEIEALWELARNRGERVG